NATVAQVALLKEQVDLLGARNLGPLRSCQRPNAVGGAAVGPRRGRTRKGEEWLSGQLKHASPSWRPKRRKGNGVFLVLCRQAGESLEDFDRRAEREIREAKQKAGSRKSFILRINGVLPRQDR